MDLSTDYLGLKLSHPVMPGASPLTDDLDRVRRLEDAGASAIVLRSLFEEQVIVEQVAAIEYLGTHGNAFGDVLDNLPQTDAFARGRGEYQTHVSRVKAAVDVPVIASLNGTTPGGWLKYARSIEAAGADAIELNVYHVATDPAESAAQVERRIARTVESLDKELRIPMAVKLSPSYTSLPCFVRELQSRGADGLILFNRFSQPDFDVDTRDVRRTLELSTSAELLSRIHGVAILSGQTEASLAVSGGVHEVDDVVKSIMAGAHVTQVVSALFRHGFDRIAELRDGLEQWMERHGCRSLADLRGSMNLVSCPDPHAYERISYMESLQSRPR